MARQDMDIKGDVISELEDIVDPRHGLSLLDALLVEDLAVHKGEVDVTLVFEPDRAPEARDALKADIEDTLSDIEGVKTIRFMTMERSQMLYEVLGDKAPAPPSAPAPLVEQGATLSLSALIANADDDAAPEPEDDPAGQTRLYSGGGCAAGTVDQAVVRDESKVAAAPLRVEAPRAAAAARVDAAPEGQVLVSIEAWSALQVENQALTTRNQALEARLMALQNALRAMIDEPF